jgi:hypothetical protein
MVGLAQDNADKLLVFTVKPILTTHRKIRHAGTRNEGKLL